MNTIALEERASTTVDDFRWRHSIAGDSAATDTMDGPIAPLFEGKWFSIHRVSNPGIFHSVRFRRSQHTLMVFDRGSFIDGERRIDSLRVATIGPLGKGVDVAPANSDFQSFTGPNGNVDCLLVSVVERAL